MIHAALHSLLLSRFKKQQIKYFYEVKFDEFSFFLLISFAFVNG